MPPRKRSAPAPPPPPPAPERDYLVIFEEPDPYGLPADDTLVLDIEQPPAPARPEVDVQQKVAIELTNTTSRTGRVGLGLSIAGAALGLVLMASFAILYPHDLLGGANIGTLRTLILASVLSLILMVAGTMLTHYGRRIQARGRLSDVRIVEKAPEPRATLD